MNILRWVKVKGCFWDASVCSAAALGGHLETLKWARENGWPWDESTCAYAAGGGHLTILQWARGRVPLDLEYLCLRSGEGPPVHPTVGRGQRMPLE